MACVLVDVDGTLLDGPSTELRFVLHLMARRRIGWRQLAAITRFAVRWLPDFGRHVMKKNKAYLTGLAVEDVAAWGRSFVPEVVLPRLRPEIVDLIKAHLARGDRVVLLTGTPDFIAEPLARSLGAHAICATRCARHDGVYLAEPPLVHPFGEAKVALGRDICWDAGTTLDQATAYADSIHDLPLMLQVARPVAAWPDAGLRAIAEKGHWAILPGRARLEAAARPSRSARG
jgi:HAD superfamily hydrolase (TIGR01490 family)